MFQVGAFNHLSENFDSCYLRCLNLYAILILSQMQSRFFVKLFKLRWLEYTF